MGRIGSNPERIWRLIVFSFAYSLLVVPAIAQESKEAPSELTKTIEFSINGVGIVAFLANGETVSQYKPTLQALMLGLKAEKIPAYISGYGTNRNTSFLVFFVGAKQHPPGVFDAAGNGYPITQDSVNQLLSDARVAYAGHQAKRRDLEQQQARLQARLKAIDDEIADKKAKIAQNDAAIARLDAEVNQIKRKRQSLDEARTLIKEGKPIPTNSDGTYRDATLEALIVEYERRTFGDRRDPVYREQLLRGLSDDLARQASELEKR